VQLSSDDLKDAMPEIDLIMGTQNLDQIGKLLNGTYLDLNLKKPGHFLQSVKTRRYIESVAPYAYVKISDGCSRRCSFCIIPAIRGKLASRPVSQIVAEAENLVKKGVKELILVSQDTASYGLDLKDKTSLCTLLEALDKVVGLKWIRVLYLYPDAVDDKLLTAVRDLNLVVPYLDIPVQHASDKMLKVMRRGHSSKKLIKLFKKIKRYIPDAFLRTTVMVGHPGETGDDMDTLLKFVKEVEFNHLGAFRYSDEEGTFSFKQGAKISKQISYNRWRKVMSVQREIVKKINSSMKGREVEVLVEEMADDSGFVLKGRHAGQAPDIDGVTYLVSSDAKPGDIVKAKIIDLKGHDLVAEPI
jgi:ribosomal protein S12 methylthiotransferase